MRKWMIAAALMLAGPSNVSAQWTYQKADDNPFGGKSAHVVGTTKNGFVLAFRCSHADDLSLMLLLDEGGAEKSLAAMITRAKPKLLVIVDQADVVAMEAEADVVGSGTDANLRFVGTDPAASLRLLHALSSARQRFAVAVEILGDRNTHQTFPVSGSRNAAQKLVAGCGLESPATQKQGAPRR